jgi:hypothetical protein
MTARRSAYYGVAGALLVGWLAAANMPSPQGDDSRERGPRPAPTAGATSLADDVAAQAAKLRTRMAQAPVPNQNPRNPFAFGVAPRTVPLPERTVHAAVAPDPAPPATPPQPVLTLMGIAEENLPAGMRRTAIIGADRDVIYMVTEGQAVGDRYKVTKIGADAVELEDIVTHAYRRIALR